jgi:two-component system response regulator MtrA
MPSLLVIDDDRTVLLLFKKVFKDSGLEVHVANDAGEGMAALKEHKPDVLLLDLMLP